MVPLALALALAEFAPKIIQLLGGNKTADVASKVIDIARTVTGETRAKEAVLTLRTDPALQLEFQKQVDSQELDLQKLANENASQINETMRVEAASEHWQTYSWRPYIGFCFGTLGLSAGITVLAVYLGVLFAKVDPELISFLPGLLGAEAAIMASMAPVLGIASWFRGRMQANAAQAEKKND